jgi:hypothetical protein
VKNLGIKRQSDEPKIKGSLHSAEFTDKQNILYHYCGYFGKIARQFHLTKTTLKIPRSDGLERFLSEVNAINEQRVSDGEKKLNADELKKLEDQTRYDILNSKELGNGTSLMNHFLGEAFTGDKYRKIFDECKEEALAIAYRAMNDEKIKEPKSDVSYR